MICRNDMVQMNAVLNDLGRRIDEVFDKLALEGREWEWSMMDAILANKKVAAVVKPTSYEGCGCFPESNRSSAVQNAVLSIL